MVALQNFFMVVVLPIVSFTGIIFLFRWWLKHSTGYDPLGDKGAIPPKEHDARSETYAPYLPPKWRTKESEEE